MRTKPILTEIDGEKQYVVYIEYHDGKPHSVITSDLDFKGRRNWDFDLNTDWGEYMHYNSGGGGSIKDIGGPHYVKGYKGGSVWACSEVRYNKYKPKNCRTLRNPISLKKDGRTMVDPFKFSHQEVQDIMYCKFCAGSFSEDGCSSHMDIWEDVYNDGSPLSE